MVSSPSVALNWQPARALHINVAGTRAQLWHRLIHRVWVAPKLLLRDPRRVCVPRDCSRLDRYGMLPVELLLRTHARLLLVLLLGDQSGAAVRPPDALALCALDRLWLLDLPSRGRPRVTRGVRS